MLRVTLFVDGEPLPGAWVVVHLGTTKKNAHGFLAGPTDDDGRVDVPRHQIEERIADELARSPMDYGGLEAWDGLINVEPLTQESAAGVLEAIRLWDDLGSIDTEENLDVFKAFRDMLGLLSGAELTVAASCEPPDVATVTTSVREA
jgi:hypothetical protein